MLETKTTDNQRRSYEDDFRNQGNHPNHPFPLNAATSEQGAFLVFPEFEETERKINSFYLNGNGLAKHKRVMSNQVFIKSSANKLVFLPYILYNLLSFFIYCIGKFKFS